MKVSVQDRLSFLAQQRAISRQRYDVLHCLHYDDLWGDVEPLHATFVQRLTSRLPRGSHVLDAACGTGKYWPALLGTGMRVVGVDQSAGMLARARQKHPEVPTQLMALQDLGGARALEAGFEAVVCIDAMKFVGPEDWPGVLAGFATVLRDPGLLYLTVEQPEHEPEAEPPLDPRQLSGESLDGGGYHYYPSLEQVCRWLTEAQFGLEAQAEGDWYWHLLLRRVRS